LGHVDGVVRQGGIVKGMRKILVVPDDGGEAREYSLPRGVHVNGQEGDRVQAGEPRRAAATAAAVSRRPHTLSPSGPMG
jgi:hypothetical protein